jgi:hypothetical protein
MQQDVTHSCNTPQQALQCSPKLHDKAWQNCMYEQDWKGSFFASCEILKDEGIDTLVSIGPFTLLVTLEQAIGGQRKWMNCHSNDLYTLLSLLETPKAVTEPHSK